MFKKLEQLFQSKKGQSQTAQVQVKASSDLNREEQKSANFQPFQPFAQSTQRRTSTLQTLNSDRSRNRKPRSIEEAEVRNVDVLSSDSNEDAGTFQPFSKPKQRMASFNNHVRNSDNTGMFLHSQSASLASDDDVNSRDDFGGLHSLRGSEAESDDGEQNREVTNRALPRQQVTPQHTSQINNAAPLPKTVGSGRYVMGEKLGRGGFGTVYLGMDIMTAEHVAVKEINLENSDAGHVVAVRQEFDMLTKLKHQHVVGVRGFDVTKDNAYIYMEWMPGGSVQSMLSKFKFRLHENLVRRYTREALSGLAYLHSMHVVHRDIKPANMLVAQDGTLKLSDFGTCKTVSDKSSTTMKIVGTPMYMSPEAIRGKTSTASDVWALGASVVEMASGQPPWSELGVTDPIALLFNIGMSQSGPAVPDHLSSEGKDFLRLCFSIDPKERATCEVLLSHPFVAAGDVQSSLDARQLTTGGIEEIDTYMQERKVSNECMMTSLDRDVSVFTGISRSSILQPALNNEDEMTETPFEGYTYETPRFLENVVQQA